MTLNVKHLKIVITHTSSKRLGYTFDILVTEGCSLKTIQASKQVATTALSPADDESLS